MAKHRTARARKRSPGRKGAKLTLFTIDKECLAVKAQSAHFDDGGVFDAIYVPQSALSHGHPCSQARPAWLSCPWASPGPTSGWRPHPALSLFLKTFSLT